MTACVRVMFSRRVITLKVQQGSPWPCQPSCRLFRQRPCPAGGHSDWVTGHDHLIACRKQKRVRSRLAQVALRLPLPGWHGTAARMVDWKHGLQLYTVGTCTMGSLPCRMGRQTQCDIAPLTVWLIQLEVPRLPASEVKDAAQPTLQLKFEGRLASQVLPRLAFVAADTRQPLQP